MAEFSAAQVEIAFKILVQESGESSIKKGNLRRAINDYEKRTKKVLEVDCAAYLAFKLFQNLDRDLICAATQFVCTWNQKNSGRIVALPNPISPKQWLIGICEGIDFLNSCDSWVILRIRDNKVVVIDQLGPNFYIGFLNLHEGSPARFGSHVFYDGSGIRTVAKITAVDDYPILARDHRLFCIAAHLLNAAEQVPSELMERAIADALQARTNLQKLESDLLSLQGILKLYENRPSINPEDARAEQSRKDILRVTKGIEHLRTVYPEIPLLGPEKLDDDPDSDVTLCMVGPDRDDIIATENQNPLPDHL